MTKRTILILEADAAVAAELRELITRLGYTVCGALTCGAQAIERTAALRPDLVLVDATLPGPVDGAEAASVIGRRYALPVIFLVDGAEELPARAWDAAPYGCALKSGDGRQLRLTIDSALNLHKATETRLQRTMHDLQSREQRLKRGGLPGTGTRPMVLRTPGRSMAMLARRVEVVEERTDGLFPHVVLKTSRRGGS